MIYAFLDSQNLNIGTKKTGWVLDYAKFRNYLKTKYQVQKAFLFIGYVPGNESLYHNLQRQGFILVFKPVMQISQDDKITYKGNVDAELVLHAMIELPNYTGALIVSGDGDFHCLIEHLESIGKLAKIITPNQHYSSLLRKYAKYIVSLDKLKTKLKYKSERKSKPKA